MLATLHMIERVRQQADNRCWHLDGPATPAAGQNHHPTAIKGLGRGRGLLRFGQCGADRSSQHLAGEVSPSDIAEDIGASQQTVSNQLQRLADQRIVHARRDGQRVLYRIIDPCVPGLMDLGVCLLSQRP